MVGCLVLTGLAVFAGMKLYRLRRYGGWHGGWHGHGWRHHHGFGHHGFHPGGTATGRTSWARARRLAGGA